MKNHKRLFIIYIIMVYAVLSLSGCAGTANYDGKDLVDRAKTLHTELEAAHITVREYVRDEGTKVSGADFAAAPVVQDITYRFVGDVMQYMYIGHDTSTGEDYCEFNNGTELDTWHTGDSSWAFAAKGSEGYYNYSRVKRHYFADGGMLLDDHISAVTTSFVSVAEDGRTLVFIGYDSDKISGNEQMTGAADYSQGYYVDTDTGYCDEQQIQYRKDGRIYIYDIRISAADPDSPIERTEPAALAENTENAQ